jgi:biotin synthase
MHLRSLQSIALHIANSIFLGDYLTSEGQDAKSDLEMIRDNGFVVLGSEADHTRGSELPESTDPQIRHRGAGTEVLPNA